MTLSYQEFAFVLDVVSWLVMIICITKIVTIVYRLALTKISDIDVTQLVFELKDYLESKKDDILSFIRDLLDKQFIKFFEMLDNRLKAQEKRIKKHIDEAIQKMKDEKD